MDQAEKSLAERSSITPCKMAGSAEQPALGGNQKQIGAVQASSVLSLLVTNASLADVPRPSHATIRRQARREIAFLCKSFDMLPQDATELAPQGGKCPGHSRINEASLADESNADSIRSADCGQLDGTAPSITFDILVDAATQSGKRKRDELQTAIGAQTSSYQEFVESCSSLLDRFLACSFRLREDRRQSNLSALEIDRGVSFRGPGLAVPDDSMPLQSLVDAVEADASILSSLVFLIMCKFSMCEIPSMSSLEMLTQIPSDVLREAEVVFLQVIDFQVIASITAPQRRTWSFLVHRSG